MQSRRILASALATAAVALLGLLSSCQKANIDTNEAVRAAVVEHIQSRGDLGLGDLDIAVISAQFQGDSCQAEVRFVPKGQPAESGMTMRYTLTREGDRWKVKPSAGAAGHAMQTPAPAGQAAAPDAGDHGGEAAPKGNESALPPGHPPVAPQSR